MECISLKRKRTTFIASDVEILSECYKQHEEILDNKKTNGITPRMKSKVSKFNEDHAQNK
jgi:hypothetical protein